MVHSSVNSRTAVVSILIGVVLFAVSTLTAVAAQDTGEGPVRMIVTFEEGVFENSASQRALAARFGGQMELSLPFMNAAAILLPGKASAQALAHLPGVTGIYEDVAMTLVKKPTNPGKPGGGGGEDPAPEPDDTIDWGVDKIDADLVWDTEMGRGATVAILDTGIDADHPDLNDNVAGGIGYVAGEQWDNDGNGHGTHVAGTIASADNGVGYVGVAPEASIFAIQVLDSAGKGHLSQLVSGVQWAIENNVEVLSMSLAFPYSATLDNLPGLADILDAAEAAGIVVVAAAGNDGLSTASYPAKYPSVIAVGATDSRDRVASYSNWGTDVDVAAPGSSITSTWKNAGYATISGTSMATPHVAGVAALLVAQGVLDENGDGRTNDEVFSQIVSSTQTIKDRTNKYDFDRIDARAVLGL